MLDSDSYKMGPVKYLIINYKYDYKKLHKSFIIRFYHLLYINKKLLCGITVC
jgi:hypothetical protein